MEVLKKLLPRDALAAARRAKKKFKKARVAARPALSEEDFTEILAARLGLAEGDTVFAHSSLDELHLAFPFGRILPLLRSVVGTRGTVLFPTDPSLPSYEFLAQGHVFDVRRTPSFMGLLTEYARRQRDAVRSLHPTKSVCALGRLARELTAEHHLSPYPYDRPSPYFKLMECGGKVVGLGVSTRALSFVHTVDDALKDDFPVKPYHPRLFAARCIDADGRERVVETYAHDLSKMNHDIPRFMRSHVSHDACRDLKIKGAPFYRADATKLFEEMTRLARRGVTIYPEN